MRMTFQVALALLIGLGTLYPGLVSLLAPAQLFSQFFGVDLTSLEPAWRLAVETQVRLLASMWVAAGGGLLLAVRRFETHTLLIRCVLMGLAISALAEVLAAVASGGDVQDPVPGSLFTILVCVMMEVWRVLLLRQHRRGKA